MPADIEPEVLIVDGSRDSANVLRVALEDDNWGTLLRQLVSRSQTRRSSADNHRLENHWFHVFVGFDARESSIGSKRNIGKDLRH